MVHFRVSMTRDAAVMNTERHISNDIYFKPEEGGRILITTGDDRALAAVEANDNISAQILDESIDEDEALRSIAEAVSQVDDARAEVVAMHMKRVKREAGPSHRWQLSTRLTHKGLARMMCAVTDVLSRMCLLSKEGRNAAIRWLLDSCSDTHLVAREVVTALNLWAHVDRSRRVSMGTAGPDTFLTEGAVRIPIRLKELGRQVWHTVELEMHITDLVDKCLVSQRDLQRNGWKIVYEMNKQGQEGSFLVAPDGILFALHADSHGFPILPTEGAPVCKYSKPDKERCNLALAAMEMADIYNDTIDNADTFSYALNDIYEGSEEEEDDVLGSAFAAAADDISNKAAKVVADEEFRLKSDWKPSMRTRIPVHTPESWHCLMHCGRLLSETTAVGSDAKFNIGGKVKLGKDLNSDDLEKLELARKACTVCKQTRIKAPAARKGNAHMLHQYPPQSPESEQSPITTSSAFVINVPEFPMEIHYNTGDPETSWSMYQETPASSIPISEQIKRAGNQNTAYLLPKLE
jgi:hypothetical protein